jgi:hypothetical protein
MAKKPQTPINNDAQQRQSRKEQLIARKREQQVRNLRIAGIVVLVLIAIVIAVALINELLLTPDRAVATVGDRNITLREWQERVTYERAQRIIFLENQLEAFGGDVGIVQQFGGSVINELLDPEGLGENVLNVMAEELVICDAAAERGLDITDADVQNEINVNFGFYGEGVSPTALPEPTETIQPTPSLTPIPTAVITDVVPTETPFPTPTTGPTATPLPTPTPLSQTAFDEQFGEIMTSVTDLGATEAAYRNVVRAQLCRTRLAEALAEEQSLSRLAPQASVFVIVADSEEAADEVQAQIEADGFLTTWNTIASRIDDPEATETPATQSFELLWRTQDALEASVGPDVAAAAFELPVNEPSEAIAVDNGDGTTSYYLIMVSGREERELDESEFDTRRQELLQAFADEALTGNLQLNELWRSRVPTLPVLDSKFLAAPTSTPEIEPVEEVVPTIELVEPTAEVEETATPEPTE